MGIESIGPGAVILENIVYEIRGTGASEAPGEGVGISISSAGMGSSIKGNTISNSALEQYDPANWPADSESTYGIWIGGEHSDVVVADNLISNFRIGIGIGPSEVAGNPQVILVDNLLTGTIQPIFVEPQAEVEIQGTICTGHNTCIEDQD
jgi:hypothetical protein